MSKRSDAIVKGRDRAAARAMLRATGMDDENFEGPMIAVFNTWTNMGPCNICLLYTSPSPRDLSTSRMPSSA